MAYVRVRLRYGAVVDACTSELIPEIDAVRVPPPWPGACRGRLGFFDFSSARERNRTAMDYRLPFALIDFLLYWVGLSGPLADYFSVHTVGFDETHMVIIVIVFALSALVGTLVMIVAAAMLLPWPTRFTLTLYRTIVAIVQRSWLTLAVALIELLGRVQVTVSGTLQPPSGERATIIICNHHCRVDWLFLWCLCARMRWLRALTIMLKGPLKKVPLFGWACQAFHFIFLSRNDRQGDLSTIEQVCQHLVALGGDPPVVLCFPEGTDLSPENVMRSKAFAASKGLPVMEHLLSPRTAGFASTVRALGAQLDAVYDVTVTYTNHEAMSSKWGADPRPNEKAIFVNGYWPRAVAFHVERTPVAELLRDGDTDEALGAWLRRVWAAKEERLAKASAVPGTAPRPPLAASSISHGVVMELAGAVVGWTVVALLLAYALATAPLLGFGLIAVGSAGWATVTQCCGGLGELELRLHGLSVRSAAAAIAKRS